MDKIKRIMVVAALVCMALVTLLIEQGPRLRSASNPPGVFKGLLAVVFLGGAAYIFYGLIKEKGEK